jgi:hypothetical protein
MTYKNSKYRKRHSASIPESLSISAQLRNVLFRPRVTGAVRRAEIVRLLALAEFKKIPVNRRYCIIVDRDPDFRYMIKHGIGRLVREHTHPTNARTYFEVIAHD